MAHKERKIGINDENIVVDVEMADIIAVLNRKRYLTRNCCAGHMEHADGIPQPMTTYVQPNNDKKVI